MRAKRYLTECEVFKVVRRSKPAMAVIRLVNVGGTGWAYGVLPLDDVPMYLESSEAIRQRLLGEHYTPNHRRDRVKAGVKFYVEVELPRPVEGGRPHAALVVGGRRVAQAFGVISRRELARQSDELRRRIIASEIEL